MRFSISHLSVIAFAGLIAITSCKKDPSLTPAVPNVCDLQDTLNDSIPEPPPATFDSTNLLKINQLQMIGSHNSYRTKTYQPIYDFVQGISFLLPAQYNPDGWDYTHESFPVQLNDYNIRSMEIDIYNDPQGGQYYERKGLPLVGESAESGIAELQQPGFKVLHIPDFDYQTHHYTFVSALTELKNWSDAHPKHIPFIILIESKTSTVADVLTQFDLTEAIPFDAAAADALDAEIKSVFGNNLDRVITPDEVRGTYFTLEEAILTDGWPTLGESRGKFLLVMEGAAVSHYKSGHPSLQGRAMFVYSSPGEPEAAFVIKNNSKGDQAEINNLVEQGYIVRTRADSDTDEARTGDYSTMNAAFASGAQIVSTDYYKPDPRHTSSSDWTDYHVEFEGEKRFRINPISGADYTHWGDLSEN